MVKNGQKWDVSEGNFSYLYLPCFDVINLKEPGIFHGKPTLLLPNSLLCCAGCFNPLQPWNERLVIKRMETRNKILIPSIDLPLLNPAGVLLVTSVRGQYFIPALTDSILNNEGSFMPKYPKKQHSLQRNIVALVSKCIKSISAFPTCICHKHEATQQHCFQASRPLIQKRCASTEVLCRSLVRILPVLCSN